MPMRQVLDRFFLSVGGAVIIGVVPAATARNAEELQCARSKATPQDRKSIYEALSEGRPEAIEPLLVNLLIAHSDCFDSGGFNYEVGYVAGHYLSSAILIDYLQEEIGGTPDSIRIIDAAIEKLTPEERRRFPNEITARDKDWMRKTIASAGISGNQASLLRAAYYIAARISMMDDLVKWQAL